MDKREIDRLIAENVMGFKPIYDDNILIAFESEVSNLIFTDDDNCEWAPSTDIRDAWLVVEKIRGHKIFQLGDMEDVNGNLMYYADFQYNDGYRIVYNEAHAMTAPLAICLAVLKVIGMEAQE